MRIVLMIEGQTEQAFMWSLRAFLKTRISGGMPKLDPKPYHCRIPKGEKLREEVRRFLKDRKNPADAVIALTDVYTGTREFNNAADAKNKMRAWVGNEPSFFPHAAQYEFEAWLLPFWKAMQRMSGGNTAVPGPKPENVNHERPPSHRIADLFRRGKKRDYSKVRDAPNILTADRILEAAQQCSELKALLNTILRLCRGELIP
ncbi:MAG: DUF4276 family protein [Candidatus Sumerlaeota bacterium]|nr:DUF4276 family protein [Candidatus Sumerlaeota bacterium]